MDHDWCAVLVGRVHHPSGLFLNYPGVLFFKGRPELLEILIDLDHLLTIWLSLTTLPQQVVGDNPFGEFFMFAPCGTKSLTCLSLGHKLSVDPRRQLDPHSDTQQGAGDTRQARSRQEADMITTTTTRDINPETATEAEILAAMAGDAEASARGSGTLITEALPVVAADQARIHDLLQHEGLNTMAPAYRAYWATKRVIADRIIAEWNEIARTGRVRSGGYIETALSTVLA